MSEAKVGDIIESIAWGLGEVVEVNKNGYWIRFTSEKAKQKLINNYHEPNVYGFSSLIGKNLGRSEEYKARTQFDKELEELLK